MNRLLVTIGIGLLGALVVSATAYGAFVYLAPQPEIVSPAPIEEAPSEPTSPETPEEVKTAPYGSVTVKLGEEVVFSNLKLTIAQVIEDSRCPKDVMCIQAGTVRVRTILSGSEAVLALGKPTTVSGHTITLTKVTPERVSTASVGNGEYRFTLTVSRTLGKCYVGGCSAQLCTDQPDAVSTCEWTEAYGCYKNAVCERQASGACGWTETTELKQCLADAR